MHTHVLQVLWRRIRRTRKCKAGGWRETGVAVDRGVNVYRQRLSAEKIFGGGGSVRPRTQREGDNTPLPDCSAAAEKAFEKGRRSKRKKAQNLLSKARSTLDLLLASPRGFEPLSTA